MTIERMTKEDLPQILALDEQCFISPWNIDQFLYELEKNPYAYLLVAKENDLIVGFIDFWITFEYGSINQIAVLSNYQKRGIGSALMKEALKKMLDNDVIEVSLEVRIHNTKAIEFYLKHGFHEAFIKERYYDNGDDAYYMTRRLIYEQDNFSD